MKTISIRTLHNQTAKLVRMASHHGEIRITDRGQIVAKIVPLLPVAGIPYFSRRKPTAAFKRLHNSGKTGSGTDSTVSISQDRNDEK